MKAKPISQILPELKSICKEFGLSYDFNTPRFCSREHGCLRAYEIFKERNGITSPKKKNDYKIVLSTRAYNYAHKFS